MGGEVNNVRQTAEPLVPEPSASESEMAVVNLTTHHQILLRSQQNSGSGLGDMDWIDLAQDRDRSRALVNAVRNLRVS